MTPQEGSTAKLRFDPFDRGLIGDPYPEYRRLQAAEPVHWNELLHAWVLTGHDDVRAVLLDPGFEVVKTATLVNELARRTGRDWSRLACFLEAGLFFKDGQPHERDRRTLSRIMNRIRLSELDRVVTGIAGELADPLRGRTSFDVIADFADALPQRVMAYILDIPADDVPALGRLSSDLTLVFDPANLDTYERANRNAGEAMDLLAQRMRESGPDSALRAIWEGAPGEGEAQLQEAAALALFAYRVGAETTIGLIGLMLKALIDQPHLRPALLADPDLKETVVAEVLRLESNVQRVGRVAVEPRRIGEADIAPGDRLLLLVGAANRDPRAFEAPEDLSLTSARPDDLAFGAGKHFCLGASLARLEGRVSLAAFLDLPPLELAGEPVWFGGRTIRRLTSLPVRQVGA